MSKNEKKAGPALRFKDKSGKDFPGWQEKQFKELTLFLSTNSLSRSQLNYEQGTVKNIHYGDIHTKFRTLLKVEEADVPFINEDIKTDKIADENYCREGDLVIADASEDYNDVGKSIEIASLNGEKLLAGLHTFLVRDKVPFAKGFKGYLMQSRDVRLQIMKMATGISVLSLSKANLSKLKISVPVYEEQQKIATFLTAIDDKIENLEQQLEALKSFKKGVMQGLFSEDGEHIMGGVI